MVDVEPLVGCGVPYRAGACGEQGLGVGDRQRVPRIHGPVVVRVVEDQGQDAEEREVLVVDAGVAQRDHDPQPERPGRQCRLLAARALPVVVPGDHGVVRGGAGPGRVAPVDPLEGEFAHPRHV